MEKKVILKRTILLISLLLRGSIKYLMHYRPYMTVWVTFFVFYGIKIGIQERSMYPVVIWLFFAAVPAMIKRFMLAISRIGGRNRYDEELFGRGPRGRMANIYGNILKKANRQKRRLSRFLVCIAIALCQFLFTFPCILARFLLAVESMSFSRFN